MLLVFDVGANHVYFLYFLHDEHRWSIIYESFVILIFSCPCVVHLDSQSSDSHSKMLNNCKLSQFSECINKSRAYATHLLSSSFTHTSSMTHLFSANWNVFHTKHMVKYSIILRIKWFVCYTIVAINSNDEFYTIHSKPVLVAMTILSKIFTFCYQMYVMVFAFSETSEYFGCSCVNGYCILNRDQWIGRNMCWRCCESTMNCDHVCTEY